MRSVYTRVLVSAVAVLAFTFLVFLITVKSVAYSDFQAGGPFSGILSEQVQEAQKAYETGGPGALADELHLLIRIYPDTYRYFVDRQGRDLLTGTDLSPLLRSANSRVARVNFFAQAYVPQQSADGRYVLLFTPSYRYTLHGMAVYYLLALLAIGLLFCFLAFQFVSPLGRLTRVVQQFGAGNLKVRAHLRRKDELGKLGEAFDNMAARIEALLVAERRLLQDISHELRSPLARLSFAVELVRTAGERENAIATARKEIDRLDELIQHLLEATSSQGDPDAFHLQVVMLDEVVRDVAAGCGIEAAVSQCELGLNVTNGVALQGDPEQLRRAFENVIRNAIRYAPRFSTIEISAGRQAGNVLIAVRDYGPGVPAQHLASIFKPFFRVDDSRDSTTGGAGLGLSIVERAIAIHHGRVWAENASPGLRLLIELPVYHGGAGSPAPLNGQEGPASVVQVAGSPSEKS